MLRIPLSDHRRHIHTIAELEDIKVQVQDVEHLKRQVQNLHIDPVLLSAPIFIDQLLAYIDQLITNQTNCEFCQR